MWVENIENDKWEYVKHEIFKNLFQKGFDLIWYRDIDSVITNMNIPITDFIDDEHDFFITRDFTELNGGSVIIRSSIKGQSFNRLVLRCKSRYQNEQNAYNHYREIMVNNNTMKVLPHPSINSYKYYLYPECKEYVGREDLGDWKEGNFVLHVPALALSKRLEILSQAKIIE